MRSITTDPPSVEILVFAGCPNAEPVRKRVAHVARELAIEPEIRVILVPDDEAARSNRFLGSPSVRVDGRDVEPGAEHRTDYAFSCRIYRTPAGLAGQPDETWLREAMKR
ncbi:MAG: thioredoxin family protein [Actinobacteria bacterium]|nr:thioredoxin family protein [Actinomycetota bacterium]